MNLINAFAIVAAFGLATVAHAQAQRPQIPTQTDSQRDAVSSTWGPDAGATSLSARWVSAIVGMKVETPAGAHLGTVKDVIVDAYGRATFAIVAYGGMMGLGNNYTAVPWTSVAEMLHRDRLLVDQAQLENAPLLAGARPDSANTSWRREADSYWRGKLALGAAASVAAPAVPGASAPASQSGTASKQRK
jgi:sporulation protein YlmC with PRC-barrel domain